MLQDLVEGLRVFGFAAAEWGRRVGQKPMPPRRAAPPLNPDREMRPAPLPPPPPARPIADLCPVPTVQLGDRWIACLAPRVNGKCPLHGTFPPADEVGNQA